MRVGGIDLDVIFCQRLSIGLSLVTIAIWFCLSFSTAVLLLTAFCFGAGILSISLDLSTGHQLPNFLSHLQRPFITGGDASSKRRLKTSHQKDENILAPLEIDEALEQLYERLLQEYIYTWYSLLSYDEDFVQEIRQIFRHATLELWRRLSKVDLTALITGKAIPIGLGHLDAVLKSKAYRLRRGQPDGLTFHNALHDYLGPAVHPASLSRLTEVEYCRALAANLVPKLIPKRYLSSKSVVLLMIDIVQGAVLQPVLDLLPNPDLCVNFLIAVAFDPEPSRKFPPESGKRVSLLQNFVSAHQESRQSALKMDLSAVLKNQSSLFGFMKFLKEENALNQLQFCLSVEDFNKRIMTPELNEDEMKLLHKEALELYDLYFKPDAKHKIGVSENIAQEIFKILDGPISDVVLLRTTAPLFQAYEEVFGQLESKSCPAFHKSEEYFNYLLGSRENDGPDGGDKLNARFWKSWLNSFKRLPFIRTGKSSPAKSVPHSATFYTNGHLEPDWNGTTSRRNSTTGSNLLQVPSLEEPSHPHLDKERSPWEIDSARNSALAHIRSKSVSCLAPEIDVPPVVKITVQKIRRKSHEVQDDTKAAAPKKNFSLHRRSHSAVALSQFDAFNPANFDVMSLLQKDSDVNRSSELLSHKSPSRRNSGEVTFLTPKSNTFPRQIVPVASTPKLGKKLIKSMSLMSSPVRQLTKFLSTHDQFSRSRSETGSSGKSEKIGKGLSKIKHGVLGKSIEGIVDNSVMDSAFDLADMYDDQLEIGIPSSCNQGELGRFSEFRDLSAWRVSIPRLTTSSQGTSGKPCFVFVVDVQRIDITSAQGDGEDLHWTVQRRYSEFYALEGKLTEFHGEFEDVRLPPRAKFSLWKGLDVLQGKRQAFEDYLVGLLQKPSLKESDILFTFLTSKEEFALAATNLGLGKIMKNVPIKLTKEKGQSLQTFIDSFLAQTQQPPPKPRYDSVIGVVAEYDGTTERLVVPHQVFGNNFSRQESEVMSKNVAQFFAGWSIIREKSVYDSIVYVLATVFCVSQATLQLCLGLGPIFRKSFDWLVDYAIDTKLNQVLTSMRIAHLCRLLEGALFDSKEKACELELATRRDRALENFQNFLRPLLHFVTGPQKFEEGTRTVFNALQDPIANKQLALVLLDAVVAELFPELEK